MSTVMQSPFILTLTFLYLFFGNVSFGQPNVYHQANYKHKPIVEMTINNTKTWVLLDTGSDITILDIKSKKKLGFSTLANAGRTVPGLGSSNNRLYRAKNVTLKFGDTPLYGPMYAFDLTNVAESIETRTGKRITAIIGTSLMQSYGFVIDICNNSVVMYNQKNNQRGSNQYTENK